MVKNTLTTFELVLSEYRRYQKGLNLAYLYPSINGHCACGCGNVLDGRKTKWSSRECNNKVYSEFAILKGNTNAIRKKLFEIDNGFCRNCGVYDESWEADHINPVSMGGGLCGIDNFQTLCLYCHKEKTKNQTASHR